MSHSLELLHCPKPRHVLPRREGFVHLCCVRAHLISCFTGNNDVWNSARTQSICCCRVGLDHRQKAQLSPSFSVPSPSAALMLEQSTHLNTTQDLLMKHLTGHALVLVIRSLLMWTQHCTLPRAPTLLSSANSCSLVSPPAFGCVGAVY
jgi:hypothetical protein